MRKIQMMGIDHSRATVAERELFSLTKAKQKELMEAVIRQQGVGGCVLLALYRQPYGDKIPFPYSEKDFDIMILDIDEETCVASIELPKQNLAPHMAASMYIVWNPKNDEMHYFTIEQRPQGEENVLCGFGENGKREELQTAPAAGNEISAVLDLVREEKEEA